MQDPNTPEREDQEGMPVAPPTEPAVAQNQPVPEREPGAGAAVDDAVGASDEPPAVTPKQPPATPVAVVPDEPVVAIPDEPVAEPAAAREDSGAAGSAVAVTPPVATTPLPRGVWTEEQAAAFRARLSEGTAKVVDVAAGAVIEAINGVADLIRSRTANRRNRR